MAPPRRILIRTATIELGALLKWTGLAPTGGEAKQLVQYGRVSVNGEVEHRRGRRIHPGDLVNVNGQALLIERTGPS